MHQLMENFASGKVPLNMNLLNALAGNKADPRIGLFDGLFPKTMIPGSHVWLLRNLTRAVEASKLAPMDQDRELKELETSAKTAPPLAKMSFPAVAKIAAAERRADTHLACAVAALAAEQFRLSHQRWPGSLQELVKAGLLDALPIGSLASIGNDPTRVKPARSITPWQARSPRRYRAAKRGRAARGRARLPSG